MDFVACVKQFVKERGVKGIAERSFYSIILDYNPFEEEDNGRAIKSILKILSESGKLAVIPQMSANDTQWKIEVSNIISYSESQGLNKEYASELLHKLLLGVGIINSRFDWDKEFASKKSQSASSFPTSSKQSGSRKTNANTYSNTYASNPIQSQSFWTTPSQSSNNSWSTNGSNVSKKRNSHPRKNYLKEDFVWLKENASGVFFAYFVVCVLGLVVSLVVIIVGWVADTGHAPMWTWLLWESLAIGIVSLVVSVSAFE